LVENKETLVENKEILVENKEILFENKEILDFAITDRFVLKIWIFNHNIEFP